MLVLQCFRGTHSANWTRWILYSTPEANRDLNGYIISCVFICSMYFSFSLSGSNKVAFLVSNYKPPQRTDPISHAMSQSATPLISPALRARLSLQPALSQYLERGQVLAWADEPLELHAGKLIEIARLEPNPTGILSLCSLM